MHVPLEILLGSVSAENSIQVTVKFITIHTREDIITIVRPRFIII